MAKDEMTPVRYDIILALADNQMRISQTARKLFLDRNTVVYHIGLIKSITGKDPMNFYDLCQLVQMAKGQRVNETFLAEANAFLETFWKRVNAGEFIRRAEDGTAKD